MKNIIYTLLLAAVSFFTSDPNCFAQANTSLSNLTSPTGVNVALLPASDNAIDLGSSGNSWKNLYLDGSIYLDNNKFISNDGSFSAFMGYLSGTTNTGSYNSGFGSNAMFSVISGSSNIAIGYN